MDLVLLLGFLFGSALLAIWLPFFFDAARPWMRYAAWGAWAASAAVAGWFVLQSFGTEASRGYEALETIVMTLQVWPAPVALLATLVLLPARFRGPLVRAAGAVAVCAPHLWAGGLLAATSL